MVDWTEKYRPQALDDIYGNGDALRDLEKWADNWENEENAAILYGPPGIGKTTAAHALASEKGWNTVELNASDKRTRDEIERVAGRASGNRNLIDKTTLIIVDEADNIHGNYDRGGKRAITEIIKESSQPIVLIANDFYDLSRGLRNACKQIEFEHLDNSDVGKALRDICEAEGIEYDFDSLKEFAAQADGDLRSAVNDLQALAAGEDSLEDVELVTGERAQKTGIFPYLDGLFKEYTPKEAMEQAESIDENPEDLLRWVEENVWRVYEGEELAIAYDFLANADRWKGRTRQTQEYKYWRYLNANLTAGIASARSGKKGGWTRFQPPKWRSKDSTVQEICRKIGERAGCSMAIAQREILPFLSVMTHHCKPRGLTVRMAAYYDFDEEEVSKVTGSGKTTNKVQSIVEDAQEMQSEVHYVDPNASVIPVSGQQTQEEAKTEESETEESEIKTEEKQLAEATADPPDESDEEPEVESEESTTESTENEDEEDDNEDQQSLGDFM